MKKRYLRVTLLIIFCAAQGTLSAVSFHSLFYTHESSWLFLEDLIIKKPQKKVDSWLGIRGALTAASLATSYLGYEATKKIVGAQTGFSKVCAAGVGGCLGVIQCYALRNYFLEQAERNQITSLMKSWPAMRDKLPHDVLSSLDALNNSWLYDSTDYEAQVENSISYLKAEIYGRFPGKYKKSHSSFFTSRNLHVQLTFDLYSALKDAFRIARQFAG